MHKKLGRKFLNNRRYNITLFIVLIILSLNINISTAKAGSINQYENAVISAAQSTFELNGIKYCTDPVFIEQLTAYLGQEDIDLSESQKDEIISKMFSNIERGVNEGYLVPVVDNETTLKEEEDILDNTLDTEEAPVTEETRQENLSESVKNNTDTENNTGQDILDEIRKQPTVKTEVDQDKNKITVTKENKQEVLVVNTVIKNTGYDIKTLYIVAVTLLALMLFGIIITVKYKFFEQEEE
jgi:hypothetical protein